MMLLWRDREGAGVLGLTVSGWGAASLAAGDRTFDPQK